jgi:hypothetical protein
MGSRFSGLTARFEQGDRHAATMEHVVSDWAAGFGAIAYCSVLILPNLLSFSRISHQFGSPNQVHETLGPQLRYPS